MKVIDHPKFGRCYELTDKEDIALSRVAQGAIVNGKTVLPSGAQPPDKNLWFRGKYLVTEDYAPKGAAKP